MGIPLDFEEPIPASIANSYNLLDEKQRSKTTTVIERLDSGYYKSIYTLFHDIKLSSYIKLQENEIGSTTYVDIDNFYKFATELILRETYRLHIDFDPPTQIQQQKKQQQPTTRYSTRQSAQKEASEIDTTSFGGMIAQDFIKISTSYISANAEAYYIMTQNNMPLFSSLNLKSAIDDREISLPEPFQSTKIVPQNGSVLSNDLGFISTPSNRIPQPSLQPFEIMSNFLHPNWYSLPTVQWLKYSDLQSFAPAVDQHTLVVNLIDKGRLWLQHIGYTKFFKEFGNATTTSNNNDIEMDTANKNNTNNTNEDEDEDEDDEEDDDEDEDKEKKKKAKLVPEEPVISVNSKNPINLDNLYEWHPSHIIDDDEIEAFENGTESELVNRLILELSELKTQREVKSFGGSAEPSEEERGLYFKIQRLLREMMLASNTKPTYEPSNNLPILQTNYSGTLPIPAATTNIPKRKVYQKRR